MSNVLSVEPKIKVNKDDLSRNLKILLQNTGTREADLARSLNLPYNTIRRLVSGYTTDPRLSTLRSIADFFTIGLDALVGKGDPMVSISGTKPSPRSVPILNWDIIAKPDFIQETDLSNWSNWFPIVLANTNNLSHHAYALETRQSMEPRFTKDTLLIIDPDEEPIDTDLVLVRIKKTNEVTLRDLVIDPPDWELQSIINANSSFRLDKTQHEIIGVVVFTILQSRKT